MFLGGFALTVTPGKMGEAVKALLLRESRGIPAARTAPIVIAERFTDLAALLLLAAFGAFTFDVDRRFLVAAAVLISSGLIVLSVPPLARAVLALLGRLPGVKRFSGKLEEFYANTAILLRPAPIGVAVVLSTISWYFECLAFWVVVRGFPGATLSHEAATFIYAAMTIVGALAFVPGGLGVTEGGMLTLLGKLGAGTGKGVAAAATFITRLCTLWFAVVVGLVALTIFARKTKVAVSLPERAPAPGPIRRSRRSAPPVASPRPRLLDADGRPRGALVMKQRGDPARAPAGGVRALRPGGRLDAAGGGRSRGAARGSAAPPARRSPAGHAARSCSLRVRRRRPSIARRRWR